MSQAQDRVRESVNRNNKERLTALLHHVDIDCLRWAFFSLKKRAAPGVDEVTWDQYAEQIEDNLVDLHARVHAGTYRALPSRRRYIPKADGRQRPLGIAAIEDKVVQAAVVAILTPIYEAEFLGFSYGFRPGRSQHDALDALAYGIGARKIDWIIDADIRSFFDTISQDWLVRFVEHRIGDRRIIRLTAHALETKHIHTIAMVHDYATCFEMIRRDRRRGAPHARALLGLAQEHGLSDYIAIGMFHEGWARSGGVDREAGIAEMHQGLALLRSLPEALFMPLFMTVLAESEAEAGHTDAGTCHP